MTSLIQYVSRILIISLPAVIVFLCFMPYRMRALKAMNLHSGWQREIGLILFVVSIFGILALTLWPTYIWEDSPGIWGNIRILIDRPAWKSSLSVVPFSVFKDYYEAALLFYNAVVDLSWIACYISAEYFIYVDGKPVEVEGLTPIEEAYNALRKAEGYVQHPGADGNPFEYLRKMCPQFSDTLDFVIAFWKDFADTPVRWKYNYLKHKGSLCYKEIQEREPHKIFSLQVNDKKCPSDIRDVQATINLIDAIEELRRFDNEKLFPYIESLFTQLETLVKPSPLIF